jgi:hypothetical protein
MTSLVKRLLLLGCALLVFTVPPAAGSNRGQGKTLIACLHHGEFIYEAKPKQCAFFSRINWNGNQGRLVRDITAHSLRWQSWGSGPARATGKDVGGTLLKIVAYHRVRCNGNAYYTLVHIVRPSGRTYRMKLARCGQVRFKPPSGG